jgi:hypothetical protein
MNCQGKIFDALVNSVGATTNIILLQETNITDPTYTVTHPNVGTGTLHSNGEPPHPALATTSTETIVFCIGFGFTALFYVSLEIFREFYVDFVDIRREITVFM